MTTIFKSFKVFDKLPNAVPKLSKPSLESSKLKLDLKIILFFYLPIEI